MNKNELTEIFEKFNTAAYSNVIVYKDMTKKDFDEKVRKTINLMDAEYQRVIQKSFIEKNDIWWFTYYRKSSFYNLRSKVISTFLFVFNNL